MRWLLEMLLRSNRLRGLSEPQLRQLIESSTDVEALRIIKDHLESASFKYPHLEGRSKELIQECVERAKEIRWYENIDHIKELFFDKLDPFAVVEKISWFV